MIKESSANERKVNIKLVRKEKLQSSQEIEKHRSNLKEILQHSNATPIRYHGDIGYACCFCTNQYPIPADLKKHNIEAHNETFDEKLIHTDLHKLCIKLDITDLTCKVCAANVSNIEDLMKHLKDDHMKQIFLDIKHHILPFKFNSEILQCYICLNIFNKFKSMLEHMNMHYKNFVCNVCDAGFVNKRKLYFHMSGHGSGTYNCDRCPKVFNTYGKKRSHERQFHDKASMVNKCGFCKEMFKNNRQKEKHLVKEHGADSFARKCRACDKVFVHQNALMIHMKRDHLCLRPHVCRECQKSFFSSTQLKRHMIKHTGKREFHCEVCLKSYARKWTLREHMRIHSDDRRFKCEHCGLAFIQKCSWRGHMRAKHTEEPV